MFSGLSVSYSSSKTKAEDTEFTVQIKAMKRGYCPYHPTIRVRNINKAIAYGGKDIPCPECTQNNNANDSFIGEKKYCLFHPEIKIRFSGLKGGRLYKYKPCHICGRRNNDRNSENAGLMSEKEKARKIMSDDDHVNVAGVAVNELHRPPKLTKESMSGENKVIPAGSNSEDSAASKNSESANVTVTLSLESVIPATTYSTPPPSPVTPVEAYVLPEGHRTLTSLTNAEVALIVSNDELLRKYTHDVRVSGVHGEALAKNKFSVDDYVEHFKMNKLSAMHFAEKIATIKAHGVDLRPLESKVNKDLVPFSALSRKEFGVLIGKHELLRRYQSTLLAAGVTGSTLSSEDAYNITELKNYFGMPEPHAKAFLEFVAQKKNEGVDAAELWGTACQRHCCVTCCVTCGVGCPC